MSSILNQLSSQTGDKTEQSNREVVELCLAEPQLLKEIASGMDSKDLKLAGDCTEVMTKVAEKVPELVVKYGRLLLPLIKSKNTRVRWEALHCIWLLVKKDPSLGLVVLPEIREIIEKDNSTITRDNAVEILKQLCSVSAEAAEKAYTLLLFTLEIRKDKHAARVFEGLKNAAAWLPQIKMEITQFAEEYKNHERSSVKKAANSLLKVINQ